MTEVVNELAFEMNTYNQRVVSRTREIEAAAAVSGDDPKPLWRAMKAFADDTEMFAGFIDQKRPPLASASEIAFGAFSGIVAVSTDFDSADAALGQMLTQLQGLNAANIEARGMLASFRETVANQPRISAPVNKARRRLVASLNGLLEELDRSLNLGEAVEREIRESLGDHDDPAVESDTWTGMRRRDIRRTTTASTNQCEPQSHKSTLPVFCSNSGSILARVDEFGGDAHARGKVSTWSGSTRREVTGISFGKPDAGPEACRRRQVRYALAVMLRPRCWAVAITTLGRRSAPCSDPKDVSRSARVQNGAARNSSNRRGRLSSQHHLLT